MNLIGSWWKLLHLTNSGKRMENPVISFNAFDELIQEILLASEQSSQCKGVQQFEIAFCQHFNELQDIR